MQRWILSRTFKRDINNDYGIYPENRDNVVMEDLSTSFSFPEPSASKVVPRTREDEETMWAFQPQSVWVRAGSVAAVRCVFKGTFAVDPRYIMTPPPPRPSVRYDGPPRKYLSCRRCNKAVIGGWCDCPKKTILEAAATLQDCTISNVYVRAACTHR